MAIPSELNELLKLVHEATERGSLTWEMGPTELFAAAPHGTFSFRRGQSSDSICFQIRDDKGRVIAGHVVGEDDRAYHDIRLLYRLAEQQVQQGADSTLQKIRDDIAEMIERNQKRPVATAG